MKKITLLAVTTMIVILLSSCESNVDSNITFLNYAGGDVYVNFKGDLIHVTPKVPPNDEGVLQIPPEEKVELTEVFKGEYEYETIYEIPSGAASGSSSGEMAGTFIINAGTHILVVFTSSISTDGEYTIFASVTTSDPADDRGNPLGP